MAGVNESPTSQRLGVLCLGTSTAATTRNKWVEKRHTPTYQEWKPERPQNHDELRKFLIFAEGHHLRCAIEEFPDTATDLFELLGDGLPPPPWSWTTFCEGAFRKIDSHIFLHQCLDGAEFRASRENVLLSKPRTAASLKEWFVIVRESGVTPTIPKWPSVCASATGSLGRKQRMLGSMLAC